MISIIIPTYNEERRIVKSLSKVFDYLHQNNIDAEIIIVDDGSKDKTVELLEEAREKNFKIIKNQVNCGKGFSVRRGMLEAKGDPIFFTDADLSTPIEELGPAQEWFDQGYDLVIGSRKLKESKIRIKQPIYRTIIGGIFNIMTRFLLIEKIKDTQCGFKGFRKSAVEQIFNRQTLNRFSFDVEIIFIARKFRFRIKEMPVEWINSTESKVSLIKDSFGMFLDLMKIRRNDLLGKYSRQT